MESMALGHSIMLRGDRQSNGRAKNGFTCYLTWLGVQRRPPVIWKLVSRTVALAIIAYSHMHRNRMIGLALLQLQVSLALEPPERDQGVAAYATTPNQALPFARLERNS